MEKVTIFAVCFMQSLARLWFRALKSSAYVQACRMRSHLQPKPIDSDAYFRSVVCSVLWGGAAWCAALCSTVLRLSKMDLWYTAAHENLLIFCSHKVVIIYHIKNIIYTSLNGFLSFCLYLLFSVASFLHAGVVCLVALTEIPSFLLHPCRWWGKVFILQDL